MLYQHKRPEFRLLSWSNMLALARNNRAMLTPILSSTAWQTVLKSISQLMRFVCRFPWLFLHTPTANMIPITPVMVPLCHVFALKNR